MSGPLDGFKILDLTQVVSGPLAAMLMADQGADVIKVEPLVGYGDLTRLPAFSKGGLSAFYLNNNRGKRSLGVDLQTEECRRILLDLAAASDVVMQNFRPGAVERLGVGYEQVKEVNPNVVYCSISGGKPQLLPWVELIRDRYLYLKYPDGEIPDDELRKYVER